MNLTIPMLLLTSVAAGPGQEGPEGRAPGDLSLQGLGAGSGDAWRALRSGPVGSLSPPSAFGVVPARECLRAIRDQASDSCLAASSVPTSGLLFPYPGIDNTFTGPAFVGGGESNRATGTRSTIGGGYNNTAYGSASTIAGGFDNTSGLDASIGGGRYNSGTNGAAIGGGRNNTASAPLSVVGGGLRNTISAGFATIGGGRDNDASGSDSTVAGGRGNWTSESNAAVGGGYGNLASGMQATIAGGSRNTASGTDSAVGGGSDNIASGRGSTVGGGGTISGKNLASGRFGTVGGGRGNTAAGRNSTVPGGTDNAALGASSFAAGRRAKANHDGTFVWGDSFDADKPSSAADTFNVYASGGATFYTDSAATTGVTLAPGAGSWSMLSDRAAKENTEPVDAREVLERVRSVPIATWNYKAQDDSIRHMGPMAQDFHAAFGLGAGDERIDAVDTDGVALAAIQGLAEELEERLAEKDAEIADLRAQVTALKAAIERDE